MSLDPLLLDLYDAIAGLDRWEEVGQILARITGVDAAALWVVERGRVVDQSLSATHREMGDPYQEHYYKLDPWQQGLLRQPRNTVVLTCEHTDEADFIKSEFYNDFARDYGLFRAVGALLPLAPGVHATIAADPATRKRLLDETDKPKIERLLPFITRALQLRRRLQSSMRADAMKSAGLDAVTLGILCCDASGRVGFANAAAQQMARDGSGLTISRELAIGAQLRAEETRLLALIGDAASGGAGGLLGLSRNDGTTNLLMHVGPVPAHMRDVFDIEPGLAIGHALVVARLAQTTESFTETAIAQLFGVSEAQAAIMVRLHQGLSPEEIAAERGVKISTVRTQINAILQRTQSRSLRDLARLLGRVPLLREYSSR